MNLNFFNIIIIKLFLNFLLMDKIISKILRWGFKSWNIGIYRRLQNKEKETFRGRGGEHKENLTKLRNLCEAICVYMLNFSFQKWYGFFFK